jgi:hypothetical protein
MHRGILRVDGGCAFARDNRSALALHLSAQVSGHPAGKDHAATETSDDHARRTCLTASPSLVIPEGNLR